MKKYVLVSFVFMAFISCKDNPVSKKINEVTESVSNATNAVQEMTTMQDDIKQLQETTPLTNEEFKTWLPEEINGMKRISYRAGQAGIINVASIQAEYANEDKSKKFSINVIDGAGQMGAAATMGARMLLSQDFEEVDENGSRKTITKNGKKAIEEYRTDNNRSKIQLLENNRFYLDVTGTNMDIEETWNAIDELDLENLS